MICNLLGNGLYHFTCLCKLSVSDNVSVSDNDDGVDGQGPDGKGGTTKVLAPSAVNRQARHYFTVDSLLGSLPCPERDAVVELVDVNN